MLRRVYKCAPLIFFFALVGCGRFSVYAPTPALLPLPLSNHTTPSTDTASSNLDIAREAVAQEGLYFDLILVTNDSGGVEAMVYRDLIARNIRATTGPDEGIDVTSANCYPHCLFVPQSQVNVVSAESWVSILRHEYRHVIQATNNSNLSRDFRDADGVFTPYAAFSEACADYGLNVAPEYFAQSRIDQLKNVFQTTPGLIDSACNGDKAAYDRLVSEYNSRASSDRAFRELFPPYR